MIRRMLRRRLSASGAPRVSGDDPNHPLARVLQNVACLMHGVTLDDLGDDARRIACRWRNPAMPSVVSQSDAVVKQISAIPDLAHTDVVLEELGYTAEQITRIRSQIRRAGAASVLDRLTERPAGQGGADLKAAFEALGVAVRAGVSADSALRLLGLDDVEMTGAVPVSLRLPEKEASALEEA